MSCLWIKKGTTKCSKPPECLYCLRGQSSSARYSCRRNVRAKHVMSPMPERHRTVAPIVSNCPKWLISLYVYYALCEKYVLRIVHYSNQIPAAVENEKAKLLWNMEIRTRTVMFHRRPGIMVFDKLGRRIVTIEVSIASIYGIRQQHNFKINRYTVNSSELPVETKLPYPPGPNLVGDLRETYGAKTCGEHLAETCGYLSDILGCPPSKCEDVIERMSRSAFIGISRIMKVHFSS